MYKVKTSILLQVENLIDEALAAKVYQANSRAKEITHRLVSVQSTLHNLILRAVQEDTWHKDMNLPDNVFFADYEMGQVTWASRCSATVVEVLNNDVEISAENMNDFYLIHELLSNLAKNEVNIAALIDIKPMFKEIFTDAKRLDLKNKADVQVVRRFFDIYENSEKLLNEYLPLQYRLDVAFQEITAVIPPTTVLAPAPEVLNVVNEMKWDLAETMALHKAEGIELSEKTVQLLESVSDIFNKVI